MDSPDDLASRRVYFLSNWYFVFSQFSVLLAVAAVELLVPSYERGMVDDFFQSGRLVEEENKIAGKNSVPYDTKRARFPSTFFLYILYWSTTQAPAD